MDEDLKCYMEVFDVEINANRARIREKELSSTALQV